MKFINKTASRKMILKPASLKQQNGSSASSENGNSFAFSSNPFLKCDKDENEKGNESNSSNPVASTTTTKSESNPSDLFKPAKPANLFTNATSLAENSNFVFGQNLHERVVMVCIRKDPVEKNNLFLLLG